jgi:hypothetical protein
MRASKLPSILFLSLCILSRLCDAYFSQQRLHSKDSKVSRQPTALKVSELHVPGYAQSKLPFILKDEHLEQMNMDGTITLRQLQEMNFQPENFESSISHNDGNLLHRTKTPLLSQEECQLIVYEAEYVASQTEWSKNRHGNFPTTDLPLVDLPETMKFLRIALVERIYPMLRAQFGMYLPDPSKLRLADGFVVKYDALGGQKDLKPHRDGSVVSFNIALNPASEFDGGGTWFASLDDAVKIDQGEVVSHSSALLHGGHGITTGKRYILVGFVILEGYDSWSMRFYNQVRNL